MLLAPAPVVPVLFWSVLVLLVEELLPLWPSRDALELCAQAAHEKSARNVRSKEAFFTIVSPWTC